MSTQVNIVTQTLQPSEVGGSLQKEKLTTGRALAANSVWNLLGQGLPLLVAAYAIPRLITALGTDRFGVLTIAWMVIGYFGLFDLGVGRALTSFVAQLLGMDLEDQIPTAIWTGTALMLGVGVISALVLGGIAHWLAYSILKVPLALKHEVSLTFIVLAAGIPPVVCTTGVRGVLEAYQRFDLSNYVRFPMGVLTFGGPLLIIPFSHRLTYVVASLVIVRSIGLVAYGVLCFSIVPNLRGAQHWSRGVVAPLLKAGGWMTISNLISPILSNFDRLLIGALLSLQAVTYYATPMEVVTKLSIVAVALSGVLFPAFSMTIVSNKEKSRDLFFRSVVILAAALFPIVIGVVAFAPWLLGTWLGPTFAVQSKLVLQVLAIGVFFNALACLPFVLLQGGGRPDLTGKSHLIEMPIYAVLLISLTKLYGINGAALAWTIRTGLDAFLLFGLSEKVLQGSFKVFRLFLYVVIIGLCSCFAMQHIPSAGTRSVLLFVLTAASATIAYGQFRDTHQAKVNQISSSRVDFASGD